MTGKEFPLQELIAKSSKILAESVRGLSASERKLVERKCSQFAQRTEQRSKTKALVFEAMVVDLGQKHVWFGPSAYVCKSTPIDDLLGVDLFIELPSSANASWVACGIDVTTSFQHKELHFQQIMKEIRNQKLVEAKHFKRQASSITLIPRLILGLERHRFEQLAYLWLKDKHEELEGHPLYHAMLNEAIVQLRNYIAYASSLANHDQVTEAFELALQAFLELKKIVIPITEPNQDEEMKGSDDQVYQHIASLSARYYG